MAIQAWSDDILLVELEEEPQFSEDMSALAERLDGQARNVVLTFAGVNHMNSSNISQLLRVRKKVIEGDRKLRLCSLNDSIWSVMLTTGLDKVFHFNEDVPTALASLQLLGDQR